MSYKKKTLQELTIKDNFMFGAAMMDVENCRGLLELLLSGESYSNLPNTYVIFICDFDPFGVGKYRYTFENRCVETEEAKLNDGQKSIFLSTCGENEEDESDELVKFLKYVKANLEESTKDYGDGYVSRIQKSVQRIKESREMGVRYMAWYDVVMAERNEAKAEGKAEYVVEVLETKGNVSDELRESILKQTDIEIIDGWFKQAISSKTIEEFIENM